MTIFQKVTICGGYSSCVAECPIGICIKNIFQSCVPPGYTCGMRKYGILSLPCQCLPLNCLCPSPNRQDLYLSFHICLRSHETCILL